jgi:ABC-type protease/lipase transport system fused ATPase/permease subunit
MQGARRLAWLEDYVASVAASSDVPVPEKLREGIRFENVSFAYPGTDRLVAENVSLFLPAGAVIALVGEKVRVRRRWSNPVEATNRSRANSDRWSRAFADAGRFVAPRLAGSV